MRSNWFHWIDPVVELEGNDAFRLYSHAQIRIIDPESVIQPPRHR